MECKDWSQFHQHFTSRFCANILAPKKLKSLTVNREKLQKTLLYEKVSSKMLVKMTPVVVVIVIKEETEKKRLLRIQRKNHIIYGLIQHVSLIINLFTVM